MNSLKDSGDSFVNRAISLLETTQNLINALTDKGITQIEKASPQCCRLLEKVSSLIGKVMPF